MFNWQEEEEEGVSLAIEQFPLALLVSTVDEQEQESYPQRGTVPN